MAFLASLVESSIRQNGLDAQPNTDYYTAQNILDAINNSVKWTMMAIQKLRSENKISDEVFASLQSVRVYRTNKHSRILFEQSVFTVDAVSPLPATESNGTPAPVPLSDDQSYVRTDLIFVKSNYSAYRKTIQEANQNRQNPFSDGYLPEGVSQADLSEGSSLNIKFSYLAPEIYNYAGQYNVAYMEILPEIPLKLCAVFVVENHPTLASINDAILFQDNMFNIVYQKALQFLTYSQGEDNTLWQITGNDIAMIMQSIT